jgi:RNA polymerase sigma factor (sigma-70 family)
MHGLVSTPSSPVDWQSAKFREALMQMVKKRVPERDAEDVVQATLAAAVSSVPGGHGEAGRPEDPDALRRWIWGIARHKVADFHRRARREDFDAEGEPEVSVPADTREANDMLKWAMRNMPEGSEETLEWLMREAEGEKLESIAESAQLPPARVRKRVSRLRAHLREHWQREVIALAALGVTLSIAFYLWRRPKPDEIGPEIARPIAPFESPELKRAKLLREEALDGVCRSSATMDECIRVLDQAKQLDPAGDLAPSVQTTRMRLAAPPNASKETEPKEKAPSPTFKSAPPSKGDSDSLSKPATPSPSANTPPPPVQESKPRPSSEAPAPNFSEPKGKQKPVGPSKSGKSSAVTPSFEGSGFGSGEASKK